ncbi:MAG: DUF6701 domain-containing protein [Neptuniibacter sp.]
MVLSRARLLIAAATLLLSTNLYAPPGGGGGGGGGGSSPITLSCNADSPDPANINELVPQGTHPGGIKFIEVKVLEDVADITGWQLCTSDKGKSPDCFSFGSGDFILGDHDDGNNDSGVTSVTAPQYFSSEQTLSSNEWEIALLDSSGDVLDYVHYCNSGCTPAYWDVPASCATGFDGTKDNWGRNPDGTGDFEKDIEPTPGTNNNGGGGEATLAYYQISHSSPSLTCEAADITITAIDSDGNQIAPSSGKTINLSAELVSGSSATNTFVPSSYTFNGSENSTTVQLIRTVAGTLDIDVTDGSITDQDGQATDPDIEFTDVAFKFYADNVADDIGTQIAGKDNTLAPGNQAITLRVIESDPSTGQCAALKPATDVAVRFGYECENPDSCSTGKLLSVDGISVSGFNNGATPEYDSVDVDFDATGTATLVLNYQDAGQIQVYASAEVEVSDGGGETVAVLGSSNSFVVRPFALRLVDIEDSTGNTNPGGDETTGSGFVSAGSDFFVTVESYLYQPADDSDQDGAPDADAVLTDNDLTPNFSQQIDFDITAYTPVGPDNEAGELEGENPLLASEFSSGSATATLQYIEVGSMSLSADPIDYLGSGEILTIPSEKIGRFYPDYFSISGQGITAACVPLSGTHFTYMQQPFEAFEYQVEARAVNGEITHKYDLGEYIVGTASITLQAEDSDNGVDLSGRVSTIESLSGWDAGVIDRTASNALSAVTFSRLGGTVSGLEDGPLNAVQLGLKLENEPDSRDFQDSDKNMKADSAGACGSACDAVEVGSTQVMRYGRLYIQSAHGPENEALSVPFSVQYWNGSNFVTSFDDSCTQLPLTNITFDGNSIDNVAARTVALDSGNTTGSLNIVGVNVEPILGDFGLSFSAPGEGNTGYFNVQVNSLDQWLRYDWDQDGSADDSSTLNALVTFGRSRGNDRLIFWQERYQ